VHRLTGWVNVNANSDQVGPWRRFKKATSKVMRSIWTAIKILFCRKRKVESSPSTSDLNSRKSLDTQRTSRPSRDTQRTSFQSVKSHNDDIPLSEVAPATTNGTTYRRSTESGRKGILKTVTNSSTQQTTNDSAKPSMERSNRDSLQVPDNEITPVQSPADANSAPRKPRAGVIESLVDRSIQTTGKSKFKRQYWKNVEVGDFVRIYNNDEIPADIVILATSDPDGACYIETKNLDGETNLKARQSLNCGREIRHARDCERANFFIESEPAHANLYQYSGVVRWNQKDYNDPEETVSEMAEPISINNLLLRGSSLRNTEWALGVVLFTGWETKIMLNAGVTPSKRSRIDRELNWNVISNFVILFIMCLCAALVEGVTWGQGNNSLDYFEFGSIGGTPALDGFITLWSSLILFQNLVPISLYISLEIIRTLQAFFIFSDIEMYYEPLDYPCTPKSWNISDDIGQIEYVFSDKTGTLTQNVMEFKKCTINGVPYGEAYTEALAGMRKRQGIDVETESREAHEAIAQDRERMLEHLHKMNPNPYLKDENLTFVSSEFVSDMYGASGEAQMEALKGFMLALATCHSVITETTPGDPPGIEFKAQSPDEAALVATARDVGISLIRRTKTGLVLNIQGEEKFYEVLALIEFNSTRKRMSTIIRMPDTGRIVLFCKGADSIIYSRLKRGEQPELRKSTADQLEVFAREGLRTLCIAQKDLTEEEFETWNRKYVNAGNEIHEREAKVEAVADEIERDLTLIGGTAIEDRLQDGVPDTIALLGDAGIKLWVLTGDKVETAINIGFSCNLLGNDMDLILVKAEEDLESAEAELDKHLAVFGMTGSDEELAVAMKEHKSPPPTHALIIDGDSLKMVLDESIRQKFLLLCKQCKSVLCCRVSPSQKAAVVQMVKVGLDVMTLSIGDGANDVAMIQEADVGIGIAGVEGRQAAMSSDFAIGQFRYLSRLMLVHGRWSYVRLSETTANFFYKNIMWVFSLFWYQIYTNFDCAYLFDYTYILTFNLFFTSLPVIVLGILDQDVPDKVALAVPQLYIRGIERANWTPFKFWSYMFDGLYQSLIVFFMVESLFAAAVPLTENGKDVLDIERMGGFVALAAVVTINLFTLLNVSRWDWFILLIVSISCLLVPFWTGVYGAFSYSGMFYQTAPEVYGQLSFWTVSLLIIVICLTPRFTGKSIQKMFFPRDVDIVREQIRQGKFDYLKTEPTSKAPSLTDNPAARSSSFSSSPSSDKSTEKVRRRSKRFSIIKRHNPKDKSTDTAGTADSNIAPPSTAATGRPLLSLHRHSRSRSQSNQLEMITTIPSNDLPSPLERLEDPTSPGAQSSRSSFDRTRYSMGKTRASYEASHDFTSAAMLTRMESSHSAQHSITSLGGMLHGGSRLRESN
jgi:phospholipid-translocating ATPase